ncbi:J domain-containing protein [Phormidium sp. CCY1219]|uniref:J domain-containing protein n=1 Tax=Phormidium sp. CCY1219 TaxID=2886104 RepID=UPI002D1F902D|nr:tetratricopeptide repeat protein [Phormidium sp. CCY1219]MEB3831747.1 DnaJ domain-containing protein [Phormidium sp. CCY1219]
MSIKISLGLFQFDFEDHHAILGVPLDAEFSQIRKRYMQIARKLHPDSANVETPADKKLATQILSKLANPAYSKLTNERARAEHAVLLGMMAKRVVQQKDKVNLTTEAAQQLLKSQDLEKDYKNAVSQLSQTQFESLQDTVKVIGEISELNLVYLQRKQSKGEKVGKPAAKKSAKAATQSKPAQKTPPPEGESAQAKAATATAGPSKIDAYCRRAQDFMEGGDFAKAVVELKEGLKIEPKNSRAHGLLGKVYVKQNQLTLASIHINQALKLNPQEESALEAKKGLQKAAQNSGKKKENQSAIAAFFGSLFGNKDKGKKKKK